MWALLRYSVGEIPSPLVSETYRCRPTDRLLPKRRINYDAHLRGYVAVNADPMLHPWRTVGRQAEHQHFGSSGFSTSWHAWREIAVERHEGRGQNRERKSGQPRRKIQLVLVRTAPEITVKRRRKTTCPWSNPNPHLRGTTAELRNVVLLLSHDTTPPDVARSAGSSRANLGTGVWRSPMSPNEHEKATVPPAVPCFRVAKSHPAHDLFSSARPVLSCMAR